MHNQSTPYIRHPSRRKPFADATARANSATPPRPVRKSALTSPGAAAGLPHNESLVPNGTLEVRGEIQDQYSDDQLQEGDQMEGTQQRPQQRRNRSGRKRRSAVIVNNGPPQQQQQQPQQKRQQSQNRQQQQQQDGQQQLPQPQQQHNGKRDSAISNASTNASSTGRRRKTHIGPWQLGRTIGKGGCSRVRAVRHSITGQYGAAKIISKAVAERVRAESLANLIQSAQHDQTLSQGDRILPFGLEREIVIMKLLQHDNIVRLYDIWENRNELYLIMEYVQGGELFSYISEQGFLPEPQVYFLFRQIIAALLYCHRIHIHHRDLKPENILLDKSSWQIKLVDFGMAALQPQGRWLSTPCGSPHYAAPELLSNKAYDGGQADVWSCGVILFVMLTGVAPFNYSGEERDLRELFQAIKRADYVMPDDISSDAQDLIRKIFVPDPNRRITIEQVWNHPFLHKYDTDFGFAGQKATIEYNIGPRPKIEEWQSLTRKSIDREILRNMRTLWHSEPEETIVQKLMNKESNHEKYFYSALVKHRDEHLENYYGTPGVGYSNSDYHHARPNRANAPALPSRTHKGSQSQFSILNDEHLYSQHSFFEPPGSEGSYDPFRSSRSPVVTGQADGYTNVTVHRGNSRLKPGIPANGSRHPSSLRIEMLKRSSIRSSRISGLSSNASNRPSSGQTASGNRRSVSRVSMSTSTSPSTPIIFIHSNSLHKRGVSFSHLRKSSTGSALTNDGPYYTPEQRKFLLQQQHRASHRSERSPVRKPRISRVPQPIPSREDGAASRLKIRKPPPPPDVIIAKEARKVSSELSRVCEEAFFRSSIGSSVRTSMTEKPSPLAFDTPPSSVSQRGSGCSGIGMTNGAKSNTSNNNKPSQPVNKESMNRPLPPLPNEPPNTFIAREVAETRQRIAARCAEEGQENAANFSDVLAHLDRLLQPTPMDQRRASAPPIRSTEILGYLPIISEEGGVTVDDNGDIRRPHGFRAVTEPVGARPSSTTGMQSTIRIVDPNSPTRVLPLNIRKKSGASTVNGTTTSERPLSDQFGYSSRPMDSMNGTLRTRPTSMINSGAVNGKNSNIANLTSAGNSSPAAKKKAGGWFRRKGPEKIVRMDSPPKIPEIWLDIEDRRTPTPPVQVGNGRMPSDPASDASSEFPMRNHGRGLSGKKGFLKFFVRKSGGSNGRKEEVAMFKAESGRPTAKTSRNSTNGWYTAEKVTPCVYPTLDFYGDDSSTSSANRFDFQHNWLSRFLHIKPASKALCFQVGRGKARQELVRLLRDWKKYGVDDVSFDRQTNTVHARVRKTNHLRIKPVSFVIELFAVLEHGRRAHLCLARFTQTRGAASSFRKIVDIAEGVFNDKGLLVEDKKKKKAMCDILG